MATAASDLSSLGSGGDREQEEEEREGTPMSMLLLLLLLRLLLLLLLPPLIWLPTPEKDARVHSLLLWPECFRSIWHENE